jgi:ADP-heptose:LPS heptosyltransferase
MGWKGALVEPFVWTAAACFGQNGEPPEKVSPKDILVLRPNNLGDVLTATPVIQALRRRFPEARLIVGVGSWGVPIISNNPFVDEVVPLDVPWNNTVVADRSWLAAIRFLKSGPQIAELSGRGGFDVGIDLLGSHVGLIMMLRLGVRFRVGIRGYRGGWSGCHRFTHFSDKVHVSQAALNQAALVGATDLPEPRPQLFPTNDERAEASALWAGGVEPSSRRFRLLVGCGGSLPEKCFPSTEMAQVLSKLTDLQPHGAPRLEILLTGGPADIERATAITSICQNGVRSICGQTSLRMMFALAEQSDLVLTNASMLLHVAAAFRRPTLAILGGPNADREAHDRLWGYASPYRSIAPSAGEKWPDAELVIATALELIRSLGTGG